MSVPEPPTPQVNSGNSGNQGHRSGVQAWKAEMSFKPDVLSVDASPSEYLHWAKRLRIYTAARLNMTEALAADVYGQI